MNCLSLTISVICVVGVNQGLTAYGPFAYPQVFELGKRAGNFSKSSMTDF